MTVATNRHTKTAKRSRSLTIAAILATSCAPEFDGANEAVSSSVVSIDFGNFPNSDDNSNSANGWQAALNNISTFALNTWYLASFFSESGDHVSRGAWIRAPADYAYALAIKNAACIRSPNVVHIGYFSYE